MSRPGKLSFLNDFENLWLLLKNNFAIIHKIFLFFETSYLRTTNAKSFEKIILFYLVKYMTREETLSISLIQNVINQIMLLRDGKETNELQIKNLMELMDFTKIHKRNFENEYLKLSGTYYKADSLKITANFEIKYFLNYITKRFDQEKKISNLLTLSDYFSKTMLLVLEEEFLLNNIKLLIEKGFIPLIKINEFEYLKLLFNYFKRINKLNFLKTSFNDYIKETGQTIVFSKSENIINPILELKKSLLLIVQNSFENSKLMKSVIDYAFQYFINLRTNSIAEIASKYMDDLLRKKKIPNTDEETLKKKLDEIFDIFRYLVAKDIFEAFYTKRLMKRLLLGTMSSYELENHMINKLKEGKTFRIF